MPTGDWPVTRLTTPSSRLCPSLVSNEVRKRTAPARGRQIVAVLRVVLALRECVEGRVPAVVRAEGASFAPGRGKDFGREAILSQGKGCRQARSKLTGSALVARPEGYQAGFFRRSATVVKISCESTSSDTARASDIAPTRALKVRIALDLAWRLSLPGSNPASNSRSALT